MEITKSHRVWLIATGLVGVGAGGAFLLAPVPFLASSGVVLEPSSSLLNELRAGGGGLLSCGVLILWGAFAPRLAFTATVVGALLAISYGVSRLLSMALDGMPSPVLVAVCAGEVILGLGCALGLTRRRRATTAIATRLADVAGDVARDRDQLVAAGRKTTSANVNGGASSTVG